MIKTKMIGAKLMASPIIDKKSPRLGRRAKHQSTDSRRQTRRKHASRTLERLDLFSCHFLKRSKIDISRGAKFLSERRTNSGESGSTRLDLGDSAKTPPGYDRITIFRAGSASNRYRASKIATPSLCLFRDETLPPPEIEA